MPLPDPVETPLLRPVDLIGLVPRLGRSALYEAIRRGDIPSLRVGGRVYVPTGELRRLWGVDPPIEDRRPGVAAEARSEQTGGGKSLEAKVTRLADAPSSP